MKVSQIVMRTPPQIGILKKEKEKPFFFLIKLELNKVICKKKNSIDLDFRKRSLIKTIEI